MWLLSLLKKKKGNLDTETRIGRMWRWRRRWTWGLFKPKNTRDCPQITRSGRTGMARTVSHSPEETRPADTLVWDFKSEAINYCYFSHPIPVRATLANEYNGCKQQGNSMLGLCTQRDNGQRWCSEDLRQVWKLEMKASGKAKAGDVEWLGHLWKCGLHSSEKLKEDEA